MIQRDDIQGEQRAPYAVQEHITRRGGRNPYGEPMYRLIWAPNRVVKQGGRWHDWDHNIPVEQRGGIQLRTEGGIVLPHTHKPIRIVVEVRLTRKYGFDGWVLERWCPQAMYPRAAFELCVPGTNIPLLGPYPERGDYEMAAGMPGETEIPSLSRLDDAISECEQIKHRHRHSVEQEILLRSNAAKDEYERGQQRDTENILLRLRKDRGILFGTSLAAGRIRNELARRCGMTEHVGN
jgi:hypothetical protein